MESLADRIRFAAAKVFMYGNTLRTYEARKRDIEQRRKALDKEEALLDLTYTEARTGHMDRATRELEDLERQRALLDASGTGQVKTDRRIKRLEKLRAQVAELEKELTT